MLLSAVSVLVVAQSSSEIPEGLMNNPAYGRNFASCTIVSSLPKGMRFYTFNFYYNKYSYSRIYIFTNNVWYKNYFRNCIAVF